MWLLQAAILCIFVRTLLELTLLICALLVTVRALAVCLERWAATVVCPMLMLKRSTMC